MNAAKTLLAMAALVALAACSDESVTAVQPSDGAAPARVAPNRVAPIHMGQPGAAVEGSYIVVLEPGADGRAVAAAAGARPQFEYGAALNGFAGQLNRGQLEALRHDPRVDYVEQDQVVTAAGSQWPAPWNLDRIDQVMLPMSQRYDYVSSGAGVSVYVIDSGISTGHPEFGGRASLGYTAVLDGRGPTDCNGHGTHVAGTVGSRTWGVAKAVSMVSVRVLDCSGNGSTSQLLAAIDWVRTRRTRRSVAVISLEQPASLAVDAAVTSLVGSGVLTAVAAGNGNAPACDYSPAGTSAAVTVAASDSRDFRAGFSNYGSCVDLYAPGVAVTSTWLNDETRELSGTSMAAPHVAGVAALVIASIPNYESHIQGRAMVESWIKAHATDHQIQANVLGTTGLLLNKRSL